MSHVVIIIVYKMITNKQTQMAPTADTIAITIAPTFLT